MSIKGTKSIFSNEIIFVGSCTLASVGITAIVTPAVHALETFLKRHITSDIGKSFVDFFVGGFLPGAISKTLTAPFEVTKMLQQDSFSSALFSDEKSVYYGLTSYEILCKIAMEGGMAACFMGTSMNLVRYFPTQAFNYAFKNTIKGILKAAFAGKDGPWKDFALKVLGGGLAGAGSLVLAYPLDLVRNRLLLAAATPALRASAVAKSRNIGEAMAHIILETPEKGLSALYTGYTVSVIGIIPFRAAYFIVSDYLRERNPFNDNKDWKGIWSKFFVEQAGALSAAYLSFPLDSIRRAQQRHPEKSVWEIINIIFEVGGMSGFFYGSLQNAIRTVTSAFVLVLQGQLKKKRGFSLGADLPDVPTKRKLDMSKINSSKEYDDKLNKETDKEKKTYYENKKG